MKRSLIYLFIGLGLVACAPETTTEEPVDVTNEPVELPALEDEYDTSEHKWGYINKGGRIVIKSQFDDARNFSNGKAMM